MRRPNLVEGFPLTLYRSFTNKKYQNCEMLKIESGDSRGRFSDYFKKGNSLQSHIRPLLNLLHKLNFTFHYILLFNLQIFTTSGRHYLLVIVIDNCGSRHAAHTNATKAMRWRIEQ